MKQVSNWVTALSLQTRFLLQLYTQQIIQALNSNNNGRGIPESFLALPTNCRLFREKINSQAFMHLKCFKIEILQHNKHICISKCASLIRMLGLQVWCPIYMSLLVIRPKNPVPFKWDFGLRSNFNLPIEFCGVYNG